MSWISGARTVRCAPQLRATALASRYDKETVALTVVSSVASTYFQALEFRDRLQVARENLANGEKILHGLQLEQTAGIATGWTLPSKRPPWRCCVPRFRRCSSSSVKR